MSQSIKEQSSRGVTSENDSKRNHSSQRITIKDSQKNQQDQHKVQYGPISRRLNSVQTPVSFETFKNLHNKQAFKLKNDLNEINNANKKKMDNLKVLMKELDRINQINAKTQKLEAITSYYDKELEGGNGQRKKIESNLIQRYLNEIKDRDDPPATQRKPPLNRSKSVLGEEQLPDPGFMKPQNRYGPRKDDSNFPEVPLKRNNSMFKQIEAKIDSERNPEPKQQGAAPRYPAVKMENMKNLKSGKFEEIDPNEACLILDEEINIDDGIAISDFKPSNLLNRKITLIGKIKTSRLMFLNELYAVHQYQYMLERVRVDHQFEQNMLKELAPYSKFQDQIKQDLHDVQINKDSRQKMQEQKIRQITGILTEKQNIMAEELRLKCNELAGLTKQNKKKTNKRTRSNKSNDDYDSDDSARTKMTKRTGRTGKSGTSKTKSGMTKSKRKSSKYQNKDIKEQSGDCLSACDSQDANRFEINLDNTEELFCIVQKCTLMKTFYETYKNIKNDSDQEVSKQRLEDLRAKVVQINESKKDFNENWLRIQSTISLKPNKQSKVNFMMAGAKGFLATQLSQKSDDIQLSKNLQSSLAPDVNKVVNEKEYRNNIIFQSQNQAYDIFIDIKQKIEYMMIKPTWLISLDSGGEDQYQINQLINDDILFKQAKEQLDPKTGSNSPQSSRLKPSEDQSFDINSSQIASPCKINNGEKLAQKSIRHKKKSNKSQEKQIQHAQRLKKSTMNKINEIKEKLEALHLLKKQKAKATKKISKIRGRSNQISSKSNTRKSRQSCESGGLRGESLKSKEAKSTKSKLDEQERLLNDELDEQQQLYETIEYEQNKLQQYEILEEIKLQKQDIADMYTQKNIRDGILSIEHIELNENKIQKITEIKNLKLEVKKWQKSKNINLQLKIDDRSYQQRELDNSIEELCQDDEDKEKFQETKLLQKAISKYEGVKQIDFFNTVDQDDFYKNQAIIAPAFMLYEKNSHTVQDKILKVVELSNKEAVIENKLLKQQVIKNHIISTFFAAHKELKIQTQAIRDMYEAVGYQCKENTNTIAYKIHSIMDIAKLSYPDKDIRKIVKRYKKFWPYLPFDFKQTKTDDVDVPQQNPDELALANLMKLSKTQRLTAKQKRKLAVAQRKVELERQKKQAADIPADDDNKEIIGNVLKQLIQIRLLFVHQKMFLNFLMVQIQNIKIELNIEDEQTYAVGSYDISDVTSEVSQGTNKQWINHMLKKNDKLPKERNKNYQSQQEFEIEYRSVMDKNKQNFRGKRVAENDEDDDDIDPDFDSNLLKNNVPHEHIALEEAYAEYHATRKKQEQDRIDAEEAANNNFQFMLSRLSYAKPLGIFNLNGQLAKDKYQYSKLTSYNISDTAFVTQFIQDAQQHQESKLLEIIEPDDDEVDREQALKNLLKPTISMVQKTKGNTTQVKSRREIMKEKQVKKASTKQIMFDIEEYDVTQERKSSQNAVINKRNRDNLIPRSMLRKNNSLSKFEKPPAGVFKNGKDSSFKIRKIQKKKDASQIRSTLYDKIDQELSKQESEIETMNTQRKKKFRIQGQNADLPMNIGTSILKKRKINQSTDTLPTQKSVRSSLNLGSIKDTNTTRPSNQRIQSGRLSQHSPFPLETIPDNEDNLLDQDSMQNQDMLFVRRVTGKPQQEWYLAASDEEYSEMIGVDTKPSFDQKTLPNTLNTSSQYGMGQTGLQSQRMMDTQNIDMALQTQPNFFTDRNRPISAASDMRLGRLNNQSMGIRNPILAQNKGNYNTSSNFFKPTNELHALQSSNSQGMFHDQASQEQKVYNFLPSQTESKIKIKKIKLPKLKKNKELNEMLNKI